MKIYLVGFMGSGKTTVGKQLARKLGYAFEDLDDSIEHKYKTSIPLIFSKYDEPAFRKLEMEALHATVELSDTVIATGGGTPCFFDNMKWMNSQGLTIYLSLHPKSLHQRIVKAKRVRPLIRQQSPETVMQFIEDKLKDREPHYQQANLIVKGEDIDINKLAAEIVNLKAKHGKAESKSPLNKSN